MSEKNHWRRYLELHVNSDNGGSWISDLHLEILFCSSCCHNIKTSHLVSDALLLHHRTRHIRDLFKNVGISNGFYKDELTWHDN